MKARSFWLLVALASVAALFISGRRDWSVLTSDPVFQTGTVAAIAPDPRGRTGRWYAVYHVVGKDNQLIQVRDTSPGSGQPPAIDSTVRMIHPRGKPEQAKPIALGRRALLYLGLLAVLAVALLALFKKGDHADVSTS